MRRFPPLPQLLIAAFAAWRSNDLLLFWRTAPNIEFYGWVILLAWLFPLLLMRSIHHPKDQELGSQPVLSLIGLALVAMGMLGEFNVLEQIGFAFSIVALVPWSNFSVIWLLSSVSWMPAWTWIAGHFFPAYSFLGRCAIVLVLILIYGLQRRQTLIEDLS